MGEFLGTLNDESQRIFVFAVAVAIVLFMILLVIIFTSRIRSLKDHLAEAAEIETENHNRILELEKKLQDMQIKDDDLGRELEQFNHTKSLLKSKNETILKMQERLDAMEAKERQQLNTVEVYSREFQTMSYRYKGLKKRNESLVDEINHYRAENTKTLMKVREQERRTFEKLISLQGGSVGQSSEIKRMAEKIFEKNQKIFSAILYEAINGEIELLYKDILQYQKEIVSRFKGNLEIERDMQSDILAQLRYGDKYRDKITIVLDSLREDKNLSNAGSFIAKKVLELLDFDKGVVSVRFDKEDDSRIVWLQVALPNGQNMVIDTSLSLEPYELYRKASEGSEREYALKQFVGSLKEHIKNFSKHSEDQQLLWILIPSDEALDTLCRHETQRCDQEGKNIPVLLGPSTLMTALKHAKLHWEHKSYYDSAMQMISKTEKIKEMLEAYGKDISASSQRLEMIQDNVSVLLQP